MKKIILRKKNLRYITMFLITTFYCISVVFAQEEYVFRYCHSQPKQHPRSISMIFFKDELEKRTNGRIKVENYFSAVLGTEFEVLDMVATGALQGTRSGGFTNVNKKYNIFMLPFLVATKPVYQYFIDKGYFTWDDINEVRAILNK